MILNLDYPLDVATILKKKKAIKRELLTHENWLDKRIAILGGSTTSEIKDMLEIFLLAEGIRPTFYESAYGKYYEDMVSENETLKSFNPDIVYIHTTSVNIQNFPNFTDSPEEIDSKFNTELGRFKNLWEKIRQTWPCCIIQNNFELPTCRILGNRDVYDAHGKTNFIQRLNQDFASCAQSHRDFFINDINYLASTLGLEKWHDHTFWLSYKYALSYEAIPHLARNIASQIKAIYGKSKKCLIVDLDNTLWGGIIGDDGVNNLKLGRETPAGEAYTAFQCYLKELKARGVALAICSKNERQSVTQGLSHPDCLLREDDFSAIVANWDPKPQNIRQIAQTLNLGLDSLVFVDDNPVEREIVRQQLPMVAVPEIGSDVVHFIDIIDRIGYFEPAMFSQEDLERNRYYQENHKREEVQAQFTSHDDFLRSLEMKAQIDSFKPIYLDRITQLTNKTNQFNFTTRRYTLAEMETVAKDETKVTLFGKLTDKFGDNGIVSVMIGSIEENTLKIDLWLMSCRVFNRGLEDAMLDALVDRCKSRGIRTILGYYYKTPKNNIVSEKFGDFGFALIDKNDDESSSWKYEIPDNYERKNKFIEVTV
jgi:FkbH-like protein